MIASHMMQHKTSYAVLAEYVIDRHSNTYWVVRKRYSQVNIEFQSKYSHEPTDSDFPQEPSLGAPRPTRELHYIQHPTGAVSSSFVLNMREEKMVTMER